MAAITDGRGPEQAAAISVRGLEKRFDDVHAVRGVDFEVAAGEVFGFLGPNGAGKTTTINMLCTLAKPTAGACRCHARPGSAGACALCGVRSCGVLSCHASSQGHHGAARAERLW